MIISLYFYVLEVKIKLISMILEYDML